MDTKYDYSWRIGGCPGLYTLVNDKGDVMSTAWDLDKDVAIFRMLKDWFKREINEETEWKK